MGLIEILKKADLHLPIPLGIVDLVAELGETGPHFVILLRASQENFNQFLKTRSAEILIDFIPTTHFPNLWFRLRIDDGSKMPSGGPAYFYCEYNFNILSDGHKRRLDDIMHAQRYTILFGNHDVSQISHFHFNIDNEKRSEIEIEIEACKNGVGEYHALDLDQCLKGQHEIGQSRSISGEVINKELVIRQSERRVRIKPFPKGVEVQFV